MAHYSSHPNAKSAWMVKPDWARLEENGNNISRACDGDMEVFWGLIWVIIWHKPCYSLFITYLIVIFEVDLLLIKLWLLPCFFRSIITQNSRITWGKINSIREDIDRVCDNTIVSNGFCHIITCISQKKTHIIPSLQVWYGSFLRAVTGDDIAKTM